MPCMKRSQIQLFIDHSGIQLLMTILISLQQLLSRISFLEASIKKLNQLPEEDWRELVAQRLMSLIVKTSVRRLLWESR